MGKTNIRSKAAVEKYLTAQRESGLTVERFCKRHHIVSIRPSASTKNINR